MLCAWKTRASARAAARCVGDEPGEEPQLGNSQRGPNIAIAETKYKTQTTGPPDGLLGGRDTSDPCA